MNRKTSPYLGVLNEKRALKEPVGTFYHPSANHYRTGLCPVGKIERTGYEFKKSSGKVINVKTTCVKDVGSNGKTSTELANKLKVNPKELESYGYSTKLETDARHKALLKAIKVISYGTTKRVLVLLRIQHKAQETNATKRIYNIYDTDIKWLTNYVEKKRSTSHNKDLFKKKSVGGANANGENANGENASFAETISYMDSRKKDIISNAVKTFNLVFMDCFDIVQLICIDMVKRSDVNNNSNNKYDYRLDFTVFYKSDIYKIFFYKQKALSIGYHISTFIYSDALESDRSFLKKLNPNTYTTPTCEGPKSLENLLNLVKKNLIK